MKVNIAEKLARIDQHEKRVEPAFTYDVPAGTAAPILTLFPVSPDGRKGFLVPWTAVYPDTGARESRVVRLSDDGRQEFTLPTAGKIWLAGTDDLALMTDGTRLVVFNLLSGDIQLNLLYPSGVTILLLLAESHVSLHTYPEQGRAFFDAFTCGVRCEPINIFRRFIDAHPVGAYRIVSCERGQALRQSLDISRTLAGVP